MVVARWLDVLWESGKQLGLGLGTSALNTQAPQLRVHSFTHHPRSSSHAWHVGYWTSSSLPQFTSLGTKLGCFCASSRFTHLYFSSYAQSPPQYPRSPHWSHVGKTWLCRQVTVAMLRFTVLLPSSSFIGTHSWSSLKAQSGELPPHWSRLPQLRHACSLLHGILDV